MAHKKSCFNWKCPHCQHRNKAILDMEFEMPRYYSIEWECDKCGIESKLEWHLVVSGWIDQKKPPKLRKRRREEKNRHKEKEQEDNGSKRDQTYRTSNTRQTPSGLK